LKDIVVLGSTGSIGQNCLAIVRENRSAFRVIGLATGTGVDTLARQVDEFKPEVVSIADKNAAVEFSGHYGASGPRVLSGDEGLKELACLERAHLIVNGLVGAVGLVPTIEAVRAGKDVALANKESMVLAGKMIMGLAAQCGARVLPIDSEHSGVHQCLSRREARVRRIVLTASGGPFLNKNARDLGNVTPEEVMRHPVWKMGKRICVDSATLLNKGFEVIEARWFFSMDLSRIGVLIHPQCAVHGIVEFEDGTTLAQISKADMRIPMLYAMSFPDAIETSFESCDLVGVGPLTFLEPDLEQFPCFALALRAARAEGSAPVFLNAADEIAVSAFLDKTIRFTDIVGVLEGTLDRLDARPVDSVEGILAADAAARAVAKEIVSHVTHSS